MTDKQTNVEPVCYLGVDGGGSKTQAILVDAQGQELGRGQAGSSNYAAVGLTSAIEHITSAITQARAQAPASHIVRNAWIGLAGIDTPQAREETFPYLRPLAQEVLLTNDAELGLSALPQATGVVLIAGTGSIALGRDSHGHIQRTGGWGHILGDEGSGYALGQQALQAAVRAADGRGPATVLLERILRHWNLKKPYDLISYVYPGEDKAVIAQLSSCVMQAAREGDTVASAIVQRAAEELSLAVYTVYTKLSFAGRPLSLALCGGLLIHESDFREQILQQVRQRLNLREIALVEEPALSAARAAIEFTTINAWKRD